MATDEFEPLQSRHTVEFGIWLTGYLKDRWKYSGYHFYYDHGDSQLPNVRAIKGFYGESVTNLNRLTDVDVLLAKADGRLMLLVEIEETAHSPQKYIGSVFGILMCNQFAVGSNKNQRYFRPTDETQFILAGVLPHGRRLSKPDQVINPRLQQFSTPSDGIDRKNVRFLFHDRMTEVINRLKVAVEDLLTRENGVPTRGPGTDLRIVHLVGDANECGVRRTPQEDSEQENLQRLRWERASLREDCFDLELANPRAFDANRCEELLEAVRTEDGVHPPHFNTDASNEFQRWLNNLNTPLREQAYARLSNWFLTDKEHCRNSPLAQAGLELWNALFCARPDIRLTNPKRDDKILPERFALWWSKQLDCQNR